MKRLGGEHHKLILVKSFQYQRDLRGVLFYRYYYDNEPCLSGRDQYASATVVQNTIQPNQET